MKSIGLTGGIGSGKSRVAEMLRKAGVPVFDCDSEAKKLMAGDTDIRRLLQERIGVDFFRSGVLDKASLASFLFASEENAAIVNGIVHPKVTEAFLKWREELDSCGYAACGVESAILLESGIREYVNSVVVVDAPDEVRMGRAMLRDGVTREKIEERMRAQKTRNELLSSADWVIDNSGDECALEYEVKRMIDNVLIDK